MRTTEQIKQYLDEHFFETRRHAYGIRAILVDLFPEERDFNFRWPVISSQEKYDKPFITFNEAHDYIFNPDNLR